MEKEIKCLVCIKTFPNAKLALRHVNDKHPDWKASDVYAAYVARLEGADNPVSDKPAEAIAPVVEKVVEAEIKVEEAPEAEEETEPETPVEEEVEAEAEEEEPTQSTSKGRRRK